MAASEYSVLVSSKKTKIWHVLSFQGGGGQTLFWTFFYSFPKFYDCYKTYCTWVSWPDLTCFPSPSWTPQWQKNDYNIRLNLRIQEENGFFYLIDFLPKQLNGFLSRLRCWRYRSFADQFGSSRWHLLSPLKTMLEHYLDTFKKILTNIPKI